MPPGFVVTTAAPARGLAAALRDAYARLGRPPVAVRSSAVDEDGSAASFAGLHETFLNVRDEDALERAVAACRASAAAARARAYRRVRGLAEGSRIAVLVQTLVPADVSAVVFTAHPVTGSRADVLINASFGLGESVVGGTTTPDEVLVDRATLRVRSHRLGAKERMTVLAEAGTREVAVPGLLRNRPALDDRQAVGLARLALAVEADSGEPVDVECAVRGGDLYLLQARPITALAAIH